MMEKQPDTASDGGAVTPGERLVYLVPSEDARTSGGGIDIIELWQLIWEGRWLVLGVTLLFAAAGTAYALLATPWYRAEVLLMPAEKNPAEALAAQFGGLASLMGINLGGGSDDAEALAVLKSKGFARAFIEDQNLLVVLLADDWDPVAKQWKGRKADWPDVRDGVRYFEKKVRRVSEDRRTGLVTLSIEWVDPEVAASWANLMATRVNDQMRQRALASAKSNIDYLHAEIEETNLVTLQQAIGRLLELELQKFMFAKGNHEFSYRVVDKAQIPKRRSKPLRALILASSVIFGGLVSIAILLFRRYARSRREVAAGA